MKSPKFHIFQGADGQWYWHLRAANGRVIAQGEGYASERNVQRALDSIEGVFGNYVLLERVIH